MSDNLRPKKHHQENKNHEHTHHDEHYHFLEGIDEENIEKKKRSVWIPIMALVLIILTLTFILPLERIGSIVESKKIDSNYLIELDNNQKILFDKEIYETIRDKYIASSTEFKICLIGEKENDIYHINDYYYPIIIEATYDHVISQSCNSKSLISLHSHPSTFCIFSGQDLYSYQQLKELNPNSFIGLICDVDKFNFHGYS